MQAQKLITARRTREKLGGISEMTEHRLRNNPESGFPKPIIINNRKFYSEAEIDAWIASRPRETAGPRPGAFTPGHRPSRRQRTDNNGRAA